MGYQQYVVELRNLFPDLDFTLEEQIAEGDKVITRWSAHGTQLGDFMGIPATNKEVNVPGLILYRIADGKIAEHWMIVDVPVLMQQLGVKG
jgi:steroid delta-isomerase-like uncharacterized protein